MEAAVVKLTSPAARLRYARKLRHYATATDAAKAHDWQKDTYISHENGNRNFKKEDARKYARAFNVSVTWLVYGEGRGPSDEAGPGNVAPVATRRVPLISWIEAGKMTEVTDPWEIGSGEEEVSLDKARDVGPRAFALSVRGDSMYSLVGPHSFSEGDTIIVDPDAPLSPGCFVVAKSDIEESATFKKYRPRGVDSKGVEVIELTPLNDDHPAIILNSANPGRIIGRVKRHIRSL